MPVKPAFVAEWIRRYLEEEEPKSKSLIVSVLGDSIAPRASGVWLGDLISLLAPFGVNERLVRTSAFRLIEEDWLEAQRDGRRSFYSLTASAARRFALADEHIYTPHQKDWDGQWTIVILSRNSEAAPGRNELRRELEWEGFATLTTGMFIHPTAPVEMLQSILADLGLADKVILLRARPFEALQAESTEALIRQGWDLADVTQRYETVLERFRPLAAKLAQARLTPQQAFMIQTLLIHSFRRATLQDPRLPTSMLPPDWPGLSAYALCREIYQLTYRLAESHLQTVSDLEGAPDASSRQSLRVHQRFGGLE